jgi:hypothetical protein
MPQFFISNCLVRPRHIQPCKGIYPSTHPAYSGQITLLLHRIPELFQIQSSPLSSRVRIKQIDFLSVSLNYLRTVPHSNCFQGKYELRSLAFRSEIKGDLLKNLKERKTNGKRTCFFLLEVNVSVLGLRIPGAAVLQIIIIAGRHTGDKNKVLVVSSLDGQSHMRQSF